MPRGSTQARCTCTRRSAWCVLASCARRCGALTLQVELRASSEEGEPLLRLAPLCGTINRYTVAERVLPTKVDIAMDKVPAGIQWPALIREGAAVGADDAAPAASAARATERPRGPSKWDSLEAEEEPPASGDAELNQFFQKLYADADPDTRRAMIKSFQESNGTTLSTNWEEVRSKPTETRAPAGMEARRYEQ